ncbi:hypothetical protein KJ865_06215, partial [Myxococcota bacterium]|nr:hypothetical protein [Myxococcota bacterium]
PIRFGMEGMEEAFSCMADLGTGGCSMGQPLESMYKSFRADNPENEGFYRDNAHLAIIFISDKDDCSAKNPEIFNPEGTFSDTLGPLSSFRCSEFGIACDEEWQHIMPTGSVTYNNCHSRPDDDPRSMLYPVSRYVDFLSTIKERSKITVGALGGPFGGTITVTVDVSILLVEPSCGDDAPAGTATPAVRLKEFVSSMAPSGSDDSLFTSICESEYSQAYESLGLSMLNGQSPLCATAPLAGCPDPGTARMLTPMTSLPNEIARVCHPTCTISMAGSSDAPLERCPVYMDPSLEWGPVNPALPVEQCYYIRYDSKCASLDNFGPSRGAAIVLARRTALPYGTDYTITCAALPLTETTCDDAIDNDLDGLTDMADRDCHPELTGD